ncbi:MAG: Transposase [Mucilaginibacter sp.]|nr:Transposase [Mucilaginibacter sp.]
MTNVKTKNFTYFIGIDISKNELDYAVMQGKSFLFHREALNSSDSISNFISELKTLPKFIMSRAVFCMEETGLYGNHLKSTLKKFKANLVIENASQIKNSLGTLRGKNDKIDSIRIAQYAYTNRELLKIHIGKRKELLKLSGLFALRNRLLSVLVALKIPLKEQKTFIKAGNQKDIIIACKKSLAALKADIESIDNSIDQLIASDENIKRLYQIITSVPNVGRITAIQIIISTNEFIDIHNPKKFACYSGVAPFKVESGLFKGKSRVSHMANKKMKALLHICAIGSIRRNQLFNAYYERKIGEGKHKMAVINAVRNKIILRIFACLNQDRLFEKKHVSIHELQQV